MSNKLDNEHYFRLRQGCKDLDGTVSRTGTFRVIETGKTTLIEFEAFWCYVGANRVLQYRPKTTLSDDQIASIEIVFEETAWEEAEKVG
ncbi:hypothetical protein HY949_03225 [Candidatus Gottesmanbacteria bacterium]|nr:hypothetical protein [Candidatus Gottesmanbacteria bacterium]